MGKSLGIPQTFRQLFVAANLALVGLFVASCTQNASTLSSASYGLQFQIASGAAQVAPDINVQFVNQLQVLLSAPDGTPVSGAEVDFSLSSGTSAKLLTPKVFTDQAGMAAAVVLSPSNYAEKFTLTATVASSSLTQVFNLASPDSINTLKFSLDSTHHMTETAGKPFGFIVTVLNGRGDIETDYNGPTTLIWNNLAVPSWGQILPNLPLGNISCTFNNGVCYTASTFIATDSLNLTKMLSLIHI